MGFLDFLKPKKAATKKRPVARQATKMKRQKKDKKATLPPTNITEDPLITIAQQLTHLQENTRKTHILLEHGFESLRDDHHKILDEQASKEDLLQLRERVQAQHGGLQEIETDIQERIDLIDTDEKILELLKTDSLRAIDISEKLGVGRQYAATRLSNLADAGHLERVKKGRKIYYAVAEK